MSRRNVILVLVLLFQSVIGFAKPELAEVKAFRVYAPGSENGEFIFIVIGESQSIVSSPVGVGELPMSKDEGAIVFGNLLELAWVIHDVWDNEEKGYRCVFKTKNAEGNLVGLAKPIGQYDSRRSRSISEESSFRFFGLKGHVDVYDLSNGERVDGGPDNEFSRNGEMLFVITEDNKGRFYGNAGSSEVDVFRDDSSVVFLESTPGGNKQVTIVQKRWNTKQDGFECTHIRNTILPKFLSGGSELVRSVYPGIAKPQ